MRAARPAATRSVVRLGLEPSTRVTQARDTPSCRARSALVIRGLGGEVHDRVKKGTTFLVAGEKVGRTKIDAAEKLGTRVLDEDALRSIMGG